MIKSLIILGKQSISLRIFFLKAKIITISREEETRDNNLFPYLTRPCKSTLMGPHRYIIFICQSELSFKCEKKINKFKGKFHQGHEMTRHF